MTFLVIGRDARDEQALARRTAAREAHLKLGDQMKARGELLYAVAMLDDSGKMIGSVIVLELPSREAVDAYLRVEPYVTGDVWRNIEISAGRVGPSFVAK